MGQTFPSALEDAGRQEGLLHRQLWWRWIGPAVWLALLSGCGAPEPPAYQGAEGFRFAPPPGWVERARDEAVPAQAGHRPPDLPLPRLGAVSGERLRVRYDRLTAGRLAWLRVTAADLPAAQPLRAVPAVYAPGPGWQRQGDVEDLEVSGHPAARVAFAGRWAKQDYLCETVAVRAGARVYLVTASFPAADGPAREQVRQAVDHATWGRTSE